MSITKSTACLNTSATTESFYEAVSILINKPHVVNKRLWGAKSLLQISCSPLYPEWDFPASCASFTNTNPDVYMKELLQQTKLQERGSPVDTKIDLFFIELLPKAFSENHAFQIIIFKGDESAVSFYDVTPKQEQQKICPNFTYMIMLNNSKITLTASCDESSNSYNWLKTTLLSQFVKWTEEAINKVTNVCKESLSLVSKEKYYIKYNELKSKYGKEMVKVWPECTDPTKFVYEDIAIATYILLLWEENLNEQTFVDLGCGNGLLVYILTKEGHSGVGVDVRRRQIWDMYPDDIQLEETTITPSDTHLFPKADWIIGNHSDELTPWIPVIAARSSYNCNFFLLPCCAYNFDGTKYQRQNSSISQYTEYLQYINDLIKKCGFRSDMDRLKIPSTKRICFVSKGRLYPKEEHDRNCDNIQNLINNKIGMEEEEKDHKQNWIQYFKPREPVERVKNCTQIDKTTIEVIVNIISAHLLRNCKLESDWSAGDSLDISEVVALVSQDKLRALKSECGGLQTLLKNNHHIFKVQNGKVQLRYPKTIEEVRSSPKRGKNNRGDMKIQQRPCWFFSNHPQGCPLQNDICSYLHVKS